MQLFQFPICNDLGLKKAEELKLIETGLKGRLSLSVPISEDFDLICCDLTMDQGFNLTYNKFTHIFIHTFYLAKGQGFKPQPGRILISHTIHSVIVETTNPFGFCRIGKKCKSKCHCFLRSWLSRKFIFLAQVLIKVVSFIGDIFHKSRYA